MASNSKPTDSKATTKLRKAAREIEKGNLEEGERLCHELLHLDIDAVSFEAHYLMGQLKRRLGQLDIATNHFLTALKFNDKNADTLFQIGTCYDENENPLLGAYFLEQALELEPESYEILTQLGKCYVGTSQFKRAKEAHEKAMRLAPTNHTVQINYVTYLIEEDRIDEAKKIQEKLVKRRPNDPNALTNLGSILTILGRNDEAEKLFHKALALAPLHGTAHSLLARCRKWKEDDLGQIEKIEQKLSQSMDLGARRQIQFALSKMYDDCKQQHKAFHHAQRGNSLSHKPYEDKEGRFYNKITKKFTKKFLEQVAEPGTSDESPIFIIGAPRSGSTLIERILATSGDVVGVGECNHIISACEDISDELENQKAFPDFVLENPSRSMMDDLARRYLEKNRDLAGEARRYVDKTLFNYRHLGLITLVFPNARILLTSRNPLDNLLSCYFQDFGQGMEWSYDLQTIGEYYRRYRKQIRWWKKNLRHPILEVNYEQMIADPVNQTKRLFDFCDLEWSEECLNFHKAHTQVTTSSLWQVRQPIYKTSIARWHPYAEHLRPLIDEISDLLDEDTLTQLREMGIMPKSPLFLSRLLK